MTDPVPSSLLRQEGPQQERLDLNLAKVRARQLRVEGGGYSHDEAARLESLITEIERQRARIEVLEGSIDYLRNVIDHPVKQEKTTTKP